MKVLYDHQIFTIQKYGGISRYFTELIPRVGASGADATATMGIFQNEYGLQTSHTVNHFCSVKRPNIAKAGRIFRVASDIAFLGFAAAVRAQIYHPTYYSYFRGPRGAKRVVTVYDMIHEIFAELLDDLDARKTVAHKRRQVQAADCILAISHSTKRDLMELLGVPAEKIRVTHLASSLTLTPSTTRVKGRPFILYVGPRGKYKNFQVLLDTLEMSPDIAASHDVVCFGGGSFSPAEQNAIAERGLSHRVNLLSGGDQLLVDLYASAEAFVYPSLYEGFGIPPLEAMRYGCPVLASNVSSIPEVVGDGGLLFNPRDPSDLQNALRRVLGDPTLQASLRDKGRLRDRLFSWDQCAKDTVEAYTDVLQA